MRRKLVLIAATAAGLIALLAPATSSAQLPPLDPACVVVDVPPVHLQLGYAPNGPEDCTVLPPPA